MEKENKECRVCARIPDPLLDTLTGEKLSEKMDIEDVLLDETTEELINDDTVWEIYINKFRGAVILSTKQRAKNKTESRTIRITEDVNFEIRRLAEKHNMDITKVFLLMLVLKTYTPEERKYLLRKKRENKRELHLDKR